MSKKRPEVTAAAEEARHAILTARSDDGTAIRIELTTTAHDESVGARWMGLAAMFEFVYDGETTGYGIAEGLKAWLAPVPSVELDTFRIEFSSNESADNLLPERRQGR